MQIDGLIPFKSSTNQAMVTLYFLRIPISLCFLSSVKSTAIITGFDLSALKKTYFITFFLFLVLSFHCCLIFLHRLHSVLIQFL